VIVGRQSIGWSAREVNVFDGFVTIGVLGVSGCNSE